MRTKELRLALVCSGGVSLAVYMHGLTKEVWKLSRASMRRRHPDAASLPPADDSEAVYLALLQHLPGVDLRVMVDIIAGTSAGGINGIQLARAVVEGHDLEAATPLWLDSADSDVLLDAAGAARPWSKLWAIPLIWWVRRRGLGMADRREMAAQAEVKARLSRLERRARSYCVDGVTYGACPQFELDVVHLRARDGEHEGRRVAEVFLELDGTGALRKVGDAVKTPLDVVELLGAVDDVVFQGDVDDR